MAIYRYVTEGSFDAYMWQALETKARFIGQVITGDNAARRAEDIGGQELSYAEVKAIASGNPAVLTLAEADAELQRLTLLKKNHLDEQYVARRSVRDLPATIASLSERFVQAHRRTRRRRQPMPTTRSPSAGGTGHARTSPPFWPASSMPCQGTSATRPAFRSASIAACALALSFIRNSRPTSIWKVQLPASPMLSREHQGPRAVLNALERLAGGLRLRMRPRPARPRHRRVPASRLPGTPGQAVPSRRLSVGTDQPCVTSSRPGFRATAQSAGRRRTGRAVSELAEQIKALKAANSIEATPQRARQKHASAEEPVTARIRRRTETVHASDPAVQPDAAAPPTEAALSPAPEQGSATKRELTFQERIAMEQQGQDQEPSL